MSSGFGKRLHKSSPFFLLLQIIQNTIFPMVFGMYSFNKYTKKYGENMLSLELMIVIVVSLLSLLSLLQYWFYTYRLKKDDIEIKEGVLFKNNRKIPYTRIQNVNVLQNPLHRIFKVATLQLESASGGKPEATMRVVDLDVVQQIKDKVKLQQKVQTETNSEPDTENTEIASVTDQLLKLSSKDVFQYGIISQKGVVFAAVIVGFLYQFEALWEQYYMYLGMFFKKPDFLNWSLWEVTGYALILIALAFALLQALSIGWAFLRFHDFKLTKEDHRLHAEMGLLSKLSATIPLKRIQLFRLRENPLHRRFKKHTVTIETAGGVNTDKQGITMRWLAPVLPTAKMPEFFNHIDKKLKVTEFQWQAIPARAWIRIFKRVMFFACLITLPLLYFKSIYILFGLIGFVPVAFLYAKADVKNTLYFINKDIVSYKSGIFFKSQSHVKLSKVQSVELLESPFDRRNDMATLEIDTAGSNTLLHHVRIPYLPLKEAQKIRNFVIDRLKTLEFDW